MNSPVGFPRWCSGKEFACQCRNCKRCRFDSWARKSSWSRKWQPTPLFLPGKFHGQRSMAGYSPRGCKDLNMTQTEHAQHITDLGCTRDLFIMSPFCRTTHQGEGNWETAGPPGLGRIVQLLRLAEIWGFPQVGTSEKSGEGRSIPDKGIHHSPCHDWHLGGAQSPNTWADELVNDCPCSCRMKQKRYPLLLVSSLCSKYSSSVEYCN